MTLSKSFDLYSIMHVGRFTSRTQSRLMSPTASLERGLILQMNFSGWLNGEISKLFHLFFSCFNRTHRGIPSEENLTTGSTTVPSSSNALLMSKTARIWTTIRNI